MSRLSSSSGLKQDIEQAISKQEESGNRAYEELDGPLERKNHSEIGPPSTSFTGGLQRTVTAQDWTGPDDPENPNNWPLWQRVYHTYVFHELFRSK